MLRCLFHYKISAHRSAMISNYAVFMFVSYLIVNVVSDTNDHDCNPINITRTELQRLSEVQYDVYKRCEVSLGESLDIWFEDAITSYKCRTYFYETDPVDADNQYMNEFKIPNINKISMSEIWECKIISKSENEINIYFEINIKGLKPPQLIFVNRVALITEEKYTLEKSKSYVAQYNYRIDDTVDVSCINLDSRCTGLMTYGANGYHNKEYTSMWNVGLQKKLQDEDNNTRIYCISKCFDYDFHVTVTFREATNTYRYINVKINNQKVVGSPLSNNFRYFINYAYFYSDHLMNIECDTIAHRDVKLQLSCDNCESQEKPKTISEYKSTLSIKPNRLLKIVVEVFDITQHGTREQVVIFFTLLPSSAPKEYTTKTTSTSVTSLTSPVTPPTTSVAPGTTPLTTPSINTVGPITALPTKLLNLTGNGHNSEHPNNDTSIILKILGIVVTIVLIGVFIVIYKMKKRDCNKRSFSNNDDNVTNEDVIPAHPPQCNSEYAAPKDMLQNQTVYAEPYTPDKDPTDSCQYAILDLKEPSGNSEPRYRNQKCFTGIYSKVLQKSLREKANFGNNPDEPHYATIIAESDHIEPTYSEACVTYKK